MFGMPSSITREITGAHPIDEMGAGIFWCAPYGCPGVSPEEHDAIRTGTIDAKRYDEITMLLNFAGRRLLDCEVPGAEFWMTGRRRAC